MASLAVAVAGAAIGSTFGLTSLGFAIGSLVGRLLFPPDVPDQEGPRLEDLKVHSSTEGAPIPKIYGTFEITGQIIWAADIREVVKKESIGKGGGGGTSTTYSYFLDFAIGFCEGPMDAIRRMSANKKPFYNFDINNTGPVLKYEGLIIRIHLGDENQLPDALIESHEGVGEVPAHRGMCYISLDDYPLKDSGNSTPSISAELVRSGSVTAPLTDIGDFGTSAAEDNTHKTQVAYNTRDNTVHMMHRGLLKTFDRSTETELKSTQIIDAGAGGLILDEEGYLYTQGDAADFFSKWDPSTHVILGSILGTKDVLDVFLTSSSKMAISRILPNSYFKLRLGLFDFREVSLITMVTPHDTGGPSTFDKVMVKIIDPVTMKVIGSITEVLGGDAGTSSNCVIDDSGGMWVIVSTLAPSVMHLVRLISIGGIDPFIPEDNLIISTDTIITLGGEDQIVIGLGGLFYNKEDGTLIIAYPDLTTNNIRLAKFDIINNVPVLIEDLDLGDEYSSIRQDLNRGPANGSLWFSGQTSGSGGPGSQEVDLVTFSLPHERRIYAIPETVSGIPAQAGVIEPDTIKLWGVAGWDDGNYHAFTVLLDRISDTALPLDEVVEDICLSADLSLSQIDTTALVTDNVRGMKIGQLSSGRSSIEPLMIAYNFDAAEKDGKIHFIKRGTEAVINIHKKYLSTHEPGGSSSHIKETLEEETQIPRRIIIAYAEVERDYDTATQHSQRFTAIVAARSRKTITLPLVFQPDEAAKIAERRLVIEWLGRRRYEVTLPPRFIRILPTDIIIIDMIDYNLTLRIDRIDIGEAFIIKAQCTSDDTYPYNSIVTGAINPSPIPAIPTLLPTRMDLLDVNLVRDEDEGTGFYYTVAGVGNWPGCIIYKSNDNINYEDIKALNTESIVGRAVTVLADGPFTVFDRINTVDVVLSHGGTLSSVTERQARDGGNTCLIGNEILSFVNATLIDTNTYRLDTLRRGRRGSENETGVHTNTDRFILLETSTTQRFTAPSDLNLLRHYKAVTQGKLLEDADVNSFTLAANCLKPYSPARIAAVYSGSDIDVTWVRRIRVGGLWRAGFTAPIGEVTESYSIDVFINNVLARTLTSVTETVTYTSAQQTIDGLVITDTIKFVVYQLSDVVGRGYPGEVSIISDKTIVGQVSETSTAFAVAVA